MPWIVGDAHSYREWIPQEKPWALSEIFSGFHDLLEPIYTGYLLEGFSEELASRRFRPERPPLAFRAGWNAVAVTVGAVPTPSWKKKFGPYLAPTSPRPHGAVPLGMTLFSARWLTNVLGTSLHDNCPSLLWATKLTSLITRDTPVFCDPVLELRLHGVTEQEEQRCVYRSPKLWESSLQSLGAFQAPSRITL